MPQTDPTRDEFLHRCALAFDAGLVTGETLMLLERAIETMTRQNAAEFDGARIAAAQQWSSYMFLRDLERARCVGKDEQGRDRLLLLMADADGYEAWYLTMFLRGSKRSYWRDKRWKGETG